MSLEQGQSGGQDQEPAATQGERAMKACPDCAELVLEAARKCRYCGYRFDGQPASQASEEGLFAHLFRRAPRHHLDQRRPKFLFVQCTDHRHC